MISRIINEKAIAQAKAHIEPAKRIVTVCHTSPDGDAIGSSLAAIHVLSALGKEVRGVIPDGFLLNLRSLPGAKELVDATRYPDFARQLINEADVLLCLDFNEPRRAGKLEPWINETKAAKIVIDHHLNPAFTDEVVISHPEMPATAYLLFRFFCRLELFNFIDKKASTCLLAGIMTDTGNFSYNCSDPELFTVAAELIRKGADKEKLYRQLFDTFSENCMRLNAFAILKKMEVFAEHKAALITLSRDELNRFHYTKGDTEGLVNRPLAIPEVTFSCFMRQEADCIRISMRSLGNFPVNKVCAEYFNGGGHLNAAGGEFKGTLDEAAKHFRTILPEINKKYTDTPAKK